MHAVWFTTVRVAGASRFSRLVGRLVAGTSLVVVAERVRCNVPVNQPVLHVSTVINGIYTLETLLIMCNESALASGRETIGERRCYTQQVGV